MTQPLPNPKFEIESILGRLERHSARLEKTSLFLSRTRLAVFMVGLPASVAVLRSSESGAAWLVPLGFVVVFIALVRRHEKVAAAANRGRAYSAIKSRHLARMSRSWSDLGPYSGPSLEGDHPFAADLDLLGARSLHHLLDTSFSEGGGRRLSDWLLTPVPERTASSSRQQLVRELVPLGALRDRIALLSAVMGGKSSFAQNRFDGEVLTTWLDRHEDDERVRPILLLLSGMVGLTALLIALHIAGVLGPWWALSLTVYAGIYLLNSSLYEHLFDEAEHLHVQLERFRPVVLRIERFHFEAGSALETLVRPFQVGTVRPSAYLKKLMWLAVAASAQKSELLRVVFNIMVPWDLFFAYKLAIYKKGLREHLPEWLDVVYTLEAASSLATYAALNPEATFPEIDETSDEERPILVATGLGHPLLPRSEVVKNDYEVAANGHVAVVTGSNMSGKSTFLRVVGIAQVMAFSGGPVDATRYASGPFQLLTSMGIHDSLADGISFFYAEVRRLGAMLRSVRTTGGVGGSLVLIDEIFRGTNNRERLLGSRALLEALVEEDSISLVATHDLDLVRLGGREGFENLHFREEVEDGRMVFDYLLHEGPCPTTNALKIMELEGLPVPRTSETGQT